MEQGSTYAACAHNTALTVACDRGASAVDSIDGDLTYRVDACTPGFRFSDSALEKCDLDTSLPGVYALTFSVVDAASGARVNATRSVTVVPSCVFGENRCRSGSCSVGGSCDWEAGLTYPDAVNAAPSITLNTVTGDYTLLPGTKWEVRVVQGLAYAACTPGSLPTETAPCETGAIPLFQRVCCVVTYHW